MTRCRSVFTPVRERLERCIRPLWERRERGDAVQVSPAARRRVLASPGRWLHRLELAHGVDRGVLLREGRRALPCLRPDWPGRPSLPGGWGGAASEIRGGQTPELCAVAARLEGLDGSGNP